jgi:putative membrane protein
MLQHILLMNVMAPVCVAALARGLNWAPSARGAALLWWAAFVQMALLWAWHAPLLQQAAQGSHGIHAIMSASLFLAAVVFWTAVTLTPGSSSWRAILALLVTGKLVCLLGALLVFAPRPIYALHEMPHQAAASLDDQQLAGLLMLSACPLSYVLAGIVLAVEMINGLGRAGSAAAFPTAAANR